MPIRMWMLDLAREQAPTRDHLYQYASVAQDAGFTHLGLYLEHRFAYPSTPWAHGKGAVTPAMVRDVASEFPSLEIVPFINLLGHVEGLIYTEEGKQYREELFKGLQACPSCPGFVDLCGKILDDTLQAFSSQIVHIGGDETAQLNVCPRCQEASQGQADPKGWLYARHFGALAQKVVGAGRTPAVWGDIFLEHPEALAALPESTILFDWQYFNGVAETAKKLGSHGHQVVGCPTIHTYNAVWCHLKETEQNIREVAAESKGLAGTCLTMWEGGLFGPYDTLFPIIDWAGKLLQGHDTGDLFNAYDEAGQGRWARLMAEDLPPLGGAFAFSKIRNGLKCRLLLYSNPFLAWMHHGEHLNGPAGDEAFAVADKALQSTDDEAYKLPAIFLRSAVEFVRMAELAHKEYALCQPDAAIGHIAPARYLFEALERTAKQAHTRIGGSLADIERCKAARLHVEKVVDRLRKYGRKELGYLPAFEVITNPRFMPHDQGCWWLVNQWANQ